MTDLSLSLISPYYPRADLGDVEGGHVGGVETAIDCLSRSLARLGVDVTVYSTAEEPGEHVADGVRHVRVRRLATLFRNPVSTMPWRMPLEGDLVQVPATYPFYSDLPLWRAAARGIPTVLDYHFDAHPTGPAMAVATGVYYRTLGRALRRADLVFVKSLDYARVSAGLRGVDREKVRALPNGVDVERFRRDFPPGDYVLCVGRLIPYKGVDVLVRAMALLQERFEAPLHVAGSGPLRRDLERLAREVDADVRFLGYVPDEALPELYGRARVTVLPSRNSQEAFGITLLESMAAGTPVVASDLPGVRTVAAEGGHVVPPGDPEALAEGIARVLKGDVQVPRGEALRARIEAKYSWPAVARAALREYEALLGGRR